MHHDGSRPLLEIIEPAIGLRHAGFMQAIDRLQCIHVDDMAVESKAQPHLQVGGVRKLRPAMAALFLQGRPHHGRRVVVPDDRSIGSR